MSCGPTRFRLLDGKCRGGAVYVVMRRTAIITEATPMTSCSMRIGFRGILAVALTATNLAAGPLFNSLEFLRFSAPVGLPGVTLVAGEYAFEVAHAGGDSVVRVRYRRTNRVTFEGPAQAIDRPKGVSLQRSVILGDAGPGEVAPILAWFPLDELMGYAFIYCQGSRGSRSSSPTS